jgi:ribonuclease HII
MTHAAMRDAVLRLGVDGPVRIDGVSVPPPLTGRAQALVRGERVVPQIAAASIIAKTLRDAILMRLSARYPAFGWAKNAGYGTRAHAAALAAAGPCRHHRLSFRPVRAMLA